MTILGKSDQGVNTQRLAAWRLIEELTEDETGLVVRHEAGLRVDWRLWVGKTTSCVHLLLCLNHLCHFLLLNYF